VVETNVLIEALAALEIEIRGRSRAGDPGSEGIELVRVGDRACSVRQESDVTVAVVAVEARNPLAADQFILANAL
jgi:hypothetical protein